MHSDPVATTPQTKEIDSSKPDHEIRSEVIQDSKCSDKPTTVPSLKDDDLQSSFSRVGIHSNLTLEHSLVSGQSLPTIIYVQPDLRMYTTRVCAYFNDLILEPKFTDLVDLFSTPCLTAYALAQFVISILIVDMNSGPSASGAASSLIFDGPTSNLIEFFRESAVIPSLSDPMRCCHTFVAPLNKQVVFIPSFGAAIFDLDFGRLIPILSFLQLHNTVADIVEPTTIDQLMFNFYTTIFANHQGADHHNGELFGTNYVNGAVNYQHDNWFNERIVTLATFYAGPRQAINPQITELALARQISTDINFNAYKFLLHIGTDTPTIIDTFRKISDSLFKIDSNMMKLSQIIGKGNFTPILSHCISNAEVPTWTCLTTVTDQAAVNQLVSSDDHTFLTHHNIGQAQPIVNPVNLVFSNANVPDYNQYRLFNVDVDNFQQPSARYADVDCYLLNSQVTFWSTPYQLDIASLTIALFFGTRIVNFSISGVCHQLPNPANPLPYENSRNLSSAIPATTFFNPTFNRDGIIHEFRLRPAIDFKNPPSSIILHDSTTSKINRLYNNRIRNNELNDANPIPGITINRSNVTRPIEISNVFLSNLSSTIVDKISSDKLSGWSSFRVINTAKARQDQISFIMTLRSIFGTLTQTTKLDSDGLNIRFM